MSRKPNLKPATLSRDELLERRVADLERMLRRSSARMVPGGMDATTNVVSQTTHGLAVKNVIRHNGTSWTKSQADTAANAVVGGIVIAVLSPDVFIMATGGYVAGLSGLTAGSVHYLDATTAGALTTTAPSIAVPIIHADTTSSGSLLSRWAGGTQVHTATADPTVNDDSGDGYTIGTIWVNTSTDKVFIATDVTAGAAVWSSGGGTAPTEDGTVFCSDSAGTAGEWTMDVDIGRNATSKAGRLRILSPNASGDAVDIQGSLVTASSKKLTIREIDVCDAGTAKKMLVIGSAPY